MKITKSFEKIKQVKTVGIILRPNSPTIVDKYEIIKEHFNEENIEVLLEEKSALMIQKEEGIAFDDLCKRSDFLVSLGGDGTLISVVRRSFEYNIAILGINLGTLGFLTDIPFSEVKPFLHQLKKDEYKIDSRMMITGNTKTNNFVAFNDIVVSRKSISSMIKIHAKIDGKPFNTYFGDGVIISTPTGSTAYNLSLGGPVVFPLTDAFIVTPVAPHSLTQRPLVLPVDFEIEFTVLSSQGAVIIVDGQDFYGIEQNDSIKIKIASKKAKLIHRLERDYFEVLSEKLQWGN